MLKIKLIILFLLLAIATGYAQDLGLKHFTVDDGLPSNNVFNIYFDSHGYMWIATDKGIARYNGLDFKVFTTNDGLPDNEVFSFMEDYEGRLWIPNFKGVLCYYKDNVFHTATNTPWLKLHKKSASNFFNLFLLQKDSSILTCAVDGGSLLSIKKNRVKEISLIKINPFLNHIDWRPTYSSKINENTFHLHYTHQWFIIDSLGNIKKMELFRDTVINTIVNANIEYLKTKNGFFKPGEKFINYPLNKNSISSFIRDKQNIVALSNNALYYNQVKIFDGSNFNTLNQDNTGNIWLGTLNKGIYCVNKYFNTSYLFNSNFKNKIIASKISENNLKLIDEEGSIYNIPNKLNAPGTFYKNTKFQPELFTPSNTCVTSNGDIYSVQSTVLLYKTNSDKAYKRVNMHILSKSENEAVCKSIAYSDSCLYITTMCHIIIIKTADFYKKNDLIVNCDTLPFNTITKDRMYYSAFYKSDSSLWFSRADKMCRLKNKIVTEEKALRNKTFRQFKFNNQYLIGYTDDNKFYIYNTVSKTLDSLSQTNIIWESIYSINDSTSVINTSKNYKLLTFYPSLKNNKKTYSLVTVENPFVPQKADYIFGDGITYYFLKNGALSGFPATMVANKPLAPQPIFISVETERKTYPANAIVDLSYTESKSITVQIDNVSFNDKELTTEYSISKDDSDNWNNITGNEINLNAIGVGYGKYIIKLRSKTDASDFSKPSVLILQIATPFWAKWWFITLCVIVFLLIILGITRLFIWRQVRKRQQQFDSEMKYQQSEYKALNALMNPHFIFNSLNNIQGLINKDQKETANQYLVIFSKLIRQNMLNISKGYITLHQEIILIENYLYLEKLRFKDLINFTIDIEEEIDTETVMIPPLLIQPLVENAIIHGLLPMQSEESHLSIRIFEVNDIIHVEIEDNGLGLNQSLKKKNANSDSYGLSNLHRRIEHVKKFQKSNIEFEIEELVDSNGKTLGTKAFVTIEQL